MSDTQKDKYMELYFKNSPQNNESDFFDECERESLVVKRHISRNDKKLSRPRKIKSKLDSLASKGYDARRNYVGEKKEAPKCFKCGGANRFSKECISKRIEENEYYEVKYKKLLASLKRQNIDVKIMVAEVD